MHIEHGAAQEAVLKEERLETNSDSAHAAGGPVQYQTPSGPINVQEAYRALKREDLIGGARDFSSDGAGDLGRLVHIATALAGARVAWERKLGYALLHIAAAQDDYALCNLAQEYAREGDLPQDLELSERLYRSIASKLPADVPLGTVARRGLAELLIVRGRTREAQTIWEEIAVHDKEAAYRAACACERDVLAMRADSSIERVKRLYRLAAIGGHVQAMLGLARVLTGGSETTADDRDEARGWLLKASGSTPSNR